MTKLWPIWLFLALSHPAAADPLAAHIDALWPQLIRETRHPPPGSSLLPLPAPYVVPGGRFAELYYWDSYFTMLGLKESGQDQLVEGMIADLHFMLDRYGHIPNGNRRYYLSRSQPPLFFAMAGLSAGGYAGHLADLKREYRFWMSRRAVALEDGSRLNRYGDALDTPRPEQAAVDRALAKRSGRAAREVYRDVRAAAESGWDFSSRWFADGRSMSGIDTTEIVPIDLNSLLFGLEQSIEAGCRERRDNACAVEFAAKAAARRKAVDRHLWDPAAGAYFDYSLTRRQRSGGVTAATLYPLFVGMADGMQAQAVAERVKDTLLQAGGIVATMVPTGEQWDFPNGWAPLQWIAISGLRRYGQDELAAAIACRWIVTVGRLYDASGRMVEKYDVVTPGKPGGGGEYPVQDGFGWTNGVTRKLLALYPQFADARQYEACPAP